MTYGGALDPIFQSRLTVTASSLNWRFFDCPQLTYACFVAWRGDRVVGYLILRQTEPVELPQGIIVDLCASRSDEATIEDLVAFAIEWFGRRVTCLQCATWIPEFASVVRRFGFHARQTERPTCVVKAPDLRDQLARLSKDWLLSKADHDWDQSTWRDASAIWPGRVAWGEEATAQRPNCGCRDGHQTARQCVSS